MSAGDVLFVGWTGGDPQYKELAPSIELEPAGEGLVSKRVTINRLCFDKDKQAVVQGLPTGNAVINSNYVDTDGSVKDQFLGGGYDLISVSNAPVGVGYSRVSAVYQKVVDSVFEIGLPPGLSFNCTNGKCQIVYKGTLLEELDSGTGECTSGIGTSGEAFNVSPYTYRFLNAQPRGLRVDLNTFDPVSLFDENYYSFRVECNGVVCDEIKVAGKDLKAIPVGVRTTLSTNTIRSPAFTSLADLAIWEQQNKIPQEEIDLIVSENKASYPDTEYIKNKITFSRVRDFLRNPFDVLGNGEQVIIYYFVTYIDRVYRNVTYTMPPNLGQEPVGLGGYRVGVKAPEPSIIKTDNIIQFRLNHPYFKQPIVWREYDVTGL